MPTSLSSTTSRAKHCFQVLVGHRVAAVLDDDGLAVETLDVGQGFGKDGGFLGGLRSRCCGGRGCSSGRIGSKAGGRHCGKAETECGDKARVANAGHGGKPPLLNMQQ
jgi:hypothetical protein